MIVALLIQAVISVGIYLVLGEQAFQGAIIPRVLTALAPFLLFPAMFLWKIWSVPPRMERPLRRDPAPPS